MGFRCYVYHAERTQLTCLHTASAILPPKYNYNASTLIGGEKQYYHWEYDDEIK